MNFQEMLEQIREKNRSDLQQTLQNLTTTALAYLEEDLRSVQLNDLSVPGVIPDTFMLRANSIGLALFDNQLFSTAEGLYRTLAKATLEYRQATQNWRHLGAFYANAAAACFAQGNIDQGIIDLLRAAQDDKQTYTLKEIRDSYALQVLLPTYFGDRVQATALKIAQQIYPHLALTDIVTLCQILDNQQFFRNYIFLAYIDLAHRNLEANQQTPNEFSQLQIFSALRNIAAMFEIQLKPMSMSSNPKDTLHPTLVNLYETKAWWGSKTGPSNTFEYTRNNIGAVQNSPRLDDDVLLDALAIVPTDDDSKFWKSLLVAYVVRNYTVHHLETQCVLVQSCAEEALGHILNAMISIPRFI